MSKLSNMLKADKEHIHVVLDRDLIKQARDKMKKQGLTWTKLIAGLLKYYLDDRSA